MTFLKVVADSLSAPDKNNYIVKVDGVDSNFWKKPFGRQLDDMKLLKEFEKKAKSTHVDAKGKGTLPAVKAWIKAEKPKQYYAKWQQDSDNWKDDSVQIFYMK